MNKPYYLIVIPYGDNDFWSYMLQVGKVLYAISTDENSPEVSKEELKKVVKNTINYIFSLHKPEAADYYTEYLTKPSLWGSFMGTSFNIYVDDEAYQYLENIKFDGNREVLVMDFNDKNNPVYVL